MNKREFLCFLTLKHKSIDATLDIIFEHIDDLLTRGAFKETDRILAMVDVKQCSTEVLIGLLTTTLPARKRLGVREDFFFRVEREIRSREEWEEGLLKGLEN